MMPTPMAPETMEAMVVSMSTSPDVRGEQYHC
jgi:hypothetical protein